MKTIIDISSHTTIYNYDSLTQFDGVYIKATEGGDYISPTLDTQIRECIKRNIPFGLYHFAGKIHTAKKEYDFFKSIANKYTQRTLPDCLDYEQSKEDLQFISDFMSYAKNLIFYSYRAIVNQLPPLGIEKNKVWVAIPSNETPALNGYLGVQYKLDTSIDTINNFDVSIFDDSIYLNIYIDTDSVNKLKESVKMRLIAKGEISQRVTIVQFLIKNVYWNLIKVDGEFGNITEQAIINYQTKKGLLIDGVAGEETLNSLIIDMWEILK